MFDSADFFTNSTDDLLPPPAKRQKLETFPELHQRVLKGDAEALTEIFNNPSHTYKFNVINGVTLLNFEQLLEAIDENYTPLVSRFFTDRNAHIVFNQLAKLDYEKAKYYSNRFTILMLNYGESPDFANLVQSILVIVKKIRLNPTIAQDFKQPNFGAILEEILSWPNLIKGLNANSFTTALNEIIPLISSKIEDLERVILTCCKAETVKEYFKNLKVGTTPMLVAIKQNNFDLVRELYLMGEYPMAQREYLEFLIFKLNKQNEVNFSYSSFARFSTQDFQNEFISFLKTSRIGVSFFQTLYGENFDRYIVKHNISLDYFRAEEKKLKPTDNSPLALSIRRFNSASHYAVFIPTGNLNPAESIKKQLLQQASFFVRVDKFELSPLEFALRVNRDEELVKDFINLGADPNFYKNASPLDLAIELDFSIETISALFFAGASPYIKRSDSPHTALTAAVAKKREDVLELFHSNGVNLNFGYDCVKPILGAVELDDENMIKFLLKRNVPAIDNIGRPLIYRAIYGNKLKAAKALLDFEVEKNGNLSALVHALGFCQNVEAAHLLMQSGIDPHDAILVLTNLLRVGIQLKNEDLINMAIKLGVSPLHTSVLQLIITSEKLKPELLKYFEDYKAGLITRKTYFEAFPPQLPEADSLQEIPFSELQEFLPELGVQSPVFQSIESPKEISSPENLGASTALSSAPVANAISSSTTLQPEGSAPILDQQFFDDLFSSVSTAPQIPNSPGFGF